MAEVVPVVELNVVMHCEGCAGSVRKTIRRIPGVQSYTVDYTQQKAIVVGTADPETILSSVRKSGKMASLAVKGPPAAEAAAEAAPGQEEIKEEEKKEEKKEAKPRFSFRSKLPKMPNRPKMTNIRQKMSNLKMQDLQKRMPDLCNSLPKNFVTNACREFVTKGVFYAAMDDISDSEDSVKRVREEPVKA
jgi:copper chaperone